MESTAKISVILPIYNVERFLRQCLDSVVNQTYRNLEIILVDDGSPDNCGAICEEYASRDSRVTVIHQENRGVSVARNMGMERASGEWILFVDPDDWLELDCCERVLEIAQKEPWDVVCFQRQDNDEEGKAIKTYPPVGSHPIPHEQIRQSQLGVLAGWKVVDLLGFNLYTPWGKLYRRSFLELHELRYVEGIKREQDGVFNLYCLAYVQRAYFLDYVGYHYRVNSSSICNRRNMEMLEIKLTLLREIERFAVKFFQEDSKYEKLLGCYIYMIPGTIKRTMLFHPDGYMPYSEYRGGVMDRYYNDEIVKKYITKCNIKDFNSIKHEIPLVISGHRIRAFLCDNLYKFQYLLISGHHIWAFYWICRAHEYLRKLI